MLKKLTTVAAALTILLMASVPALAQLGPSRDPSYFWAYSPETGEYIDCRIVDRASTAYDVCLANGIDPPVEYAVRPDGEFNYTPVGLPGYTGEEISQEIRAQIQYGNAQ